MSRVNIVGFSGPMGCGKSTAIEELRKVADRPIVLVKFAQPLYDMQEMIYNRISSVYQRPATFVKDRKLLQWLGTDWGRDSISKTLWVDLWRARVEDTQALDKNALVVCDDVRFDNEAEVLSAMGGTIVRIDTNRNHERIDTNAGIKNHASEAGIDPRFVTRRIDNNGSLSEYETKLKQLFAGLTLN